MEIVLNCVSQSFQLLYEFTIILFILAFLVHIETIHQMLELERDLPELSMGQITE